MQRMSVLVDQADQVALAVGTKLSGVINEDMPDPELATGASVGERQYPDLFNAIRDKCRSIEAALYNIESTLSRLEL